MAARPRHLFIFTSKSRSYSQPAMAAVALFLTLAVALAAAAAGGDAALVEHTFVVSEIRVNHLGKDMVVPVVNGQLPGPAIEVREGDSIAVEVVNKSPHNLTIHWHGVKQRMNCWADGVGMITQCPIQPNGSFTYRFDVAGHEGTLWWHAHVACLRATVHGALVIRPRSGAAAYPFPKPHAEIPIIIGEWWETDLALLDTHMMNGYFQDYPKTATINAKLGDLYNGSAGVEDNYVLEVEHGRTYLLRIVNAALFSEYYLKIAGHRFTVVAADASYVKPYTTDVIAIAPGETVDALLVADAPPHGWYYMVARAIQPPKPETQIPFLTARGVVRYRNTSAGDEGEGAAPPSGTAELPVMPDQHDLATSFSFRDKMTGAPRLPAVTVPVDVDERMFITLAVGNICREKEGHGSPSCGWGNSIGVANMNNVSFRLPTTTALLEAHYYGDADTLAREFPDKPPKVFNFTDPKWLGDNVAFELTVKETTVRRFRYNTTVEVVFQSTSFMQSDSNPMHLHGHNFFILAHGLGNYDEVRDVEKYNLVDPPLRNTVLVPTMGWAAIRFVTDNPGVWYMHCHYEFHATMGMATVFVVENGPTPETTLPPPPPEFTRCGGRGGGAHVHVGGATYE